MKKLNALIWLVCFAFVASAQKFEGGLTGGINLTQLDGDMLSGYNKVGVNGGIWVSYPFNNKWSAGIEFLYTQKGALRQIDENNIAATFAFDKFKLNYIEVPVYGGFTYKKFTGQFGLTGGYLLGAKVEDFAGVRNYKTQLKPFETGVLLGLSYPINKKLAAQLRWQYTISSLAKGDNRTIFTDNGFSRTILGLYNNLLSVNLKYSLGK